LASFTHASLRHRHFRTTARPDLTDIEEAAIGKVVIALVSAGEANYKVLDALAREQIAQGERQNEDAEREKTRAAKLCQLREKVKKAEGKKNENSRR
jgi:hypothetical protein